MKTSSNEKGFTLIEMLVVLSIVMIITSSVIFVSIARLEETEEKRFFKQFHLDVQRMQMIAISEGNLMRLTFVDGGTKYIVDHRDVIFYENDLPSTVRLSGDSPLKGLSYHPNGVIKQFGVMRFETKKENKRVVFYIGQGRMNYEE
jgi:competence protein ComGD